MVSYIMQVLKYVIKQVNTVQFYDSPFKSFRCNTKNILKQKRCNYFRRDTIDVDKGVRIVLRITPKLKIWKSLLYLYNPAVHVN